MHQLSHPVTTGESEVFILSGSSRGELVENATLLETFIKQRADLPVRDLAFTINNHLQDELPASIHRLGIVASDISSLASRLAQARSRIPTEALIQDQHQGIYYSERGRSSMPGKLAFLLPGLGSAYPNMLADLMDRFPEVREIVDYTDTISENISERPSTKIFADNASLESNNSLASEEFAVIAVLMAEVALFELFSSLNVTPDCLMGFSTGEFGCYLMNGCAKIEEAAPNFYELSVRTARSIPASALQALTSMAVFADLDTVLNLIESANLQVYLTAHLGQENLILTGNQDEIDILIKILSSENILYHKLQVALPYHTPLVKNAISPVEARAFREATNLSPMQIETWSCSLKSHSPGTPEGIQHHLTDLFSKPIYLKETIEAMFDDGIGLFLEIGPQGILTSQVNDILNGRQFTACATNLASRPGPEQINHVVALLTASGRDLNVSKLYDNLNCNPVPELMREPANAEAAPVEIATTGTYTHNPAFPALRDELDSLCLSKDEWSGHEDLVHSFLEKTTDLHKAICDSSIDEIRDILSPKMSPLRSAERCSGAITLVESPGEFHVTCLKAEEGLLEELEQFVEPFLTEEERTRYGSITNTSSRNAWLLGRIAARDAVIGLMQSRSIRIEKADIELSYSDGGAPFARITNGQETGTELCLSIAHSSNAAAAIAMSPEISKNPGVDIEPIRPMDPDMPGFILSERESRHVREASNPDLEFLRLWTAREAAYKSLEGEIALQDFTLVDIAPGAITLTCELGELVVETRKLDENVVAYYAPGKAAATKPLESA